MHHVAVRIDGIAKASAFAAIPPLISGAGTTMNCRSASWRKMMHFCTRRADIFLRKGKFQPLFQSAQGVIAPSNPRPDTGTNGRIKAYANTEPRANAADTGYLVRRSLREKVENGRKYNAPV